MSAAEDLPALPLREIVLPWPARELHPNARVHWSRKAKASKLARHAACLLTKQAGWIVGTYATGVDRRVLLDDLQERAKELKAEAA